MDFFALYNGRYRPRKRPVAGGGVLLAWSHRYNDNGKFSG